jgi:hypothetical protein
MRSAKRAPPWHTSGHTEKENSLNPETPKNPINAILDALASQQQQGETSLIVKIEPSLIQDAMNALRDYRKLFVPVIPGVTDPAPIYEAYEQMRQASPAQHTILLFVECQTIGDFRQALLRMPIRKSSEWRSLDDGE